jgi:hypothetical protein
MDAGAPLATPQEINASLARELAPPKTRAEEITEVAGLLALVTGLIVLGIVASVAIIATPSGAKEIAVGAFGVIGSVVAAYFGLKVGSENSKKALEAQRQEAAKAQVFAAHIPQAEAQNILSQAGDAARAAGARR